MARGSLAASPTFAPRTNSLSVGVDIVGELVLERLQLLTGRQFHEPLEGQGGTRPCPLTVDDLGEIDRAVA